jgi:hypothetical protein
MMMGRKLDQLTSDLDDLLCETVSRVISEGNLAAKSGASSFEIEEKLSCVEKILQNNPTSQVGRKLESLRSTMEFPVAELLMLMAIQKDNCREIVEFVVRVYASVYDLMRTPSVPSKNQKLENYLISARLLVAMEWTPEQLIVAAKLIFQEPQHAVGSIYLISAWQGQWGSLPPPTINEIQSAITHLTGECHRLASDILSYRQQM